MRAKRLIIWLIVVLSVVFLISPVMAGQGRSSGRGTAVKAQGDGPKAMSQKRNDQSKQHKYRYQKNQSDTVTAEQARMQERRELQVREEQQIGEILTPTIEVPGLEKITPTKTD